LSIYYLLPGSQPGSVAAESTAVPAPSETTSVSCPGLRADRRPGPVHVSSQYTSHCQYTEQRREHPTLAAAVCAAVHWPRS